MTEENNEQFIFEQLQNATDWFSLFSNWFTHAKKNEPDNPDAFALASVDTHHYPNVRIVLMKEFSPKGLTFYTNYHSQKGQEILQNPHVALCFHWKSLHRQIRMRGLAQKITAATADLYFDSRPYMSKIGAWASDQSQILPQRELFEEKIQKIKQTYPSEQKVPRPPHWSGFCIQPLEIEFWHERQSRLHDRVVFSRTDITQTDWQKKYLYP